MTLITLLHFAGTNDLFSSRKGCIQRTRDCTSTEIRHRSHVASRGQTFRVHARGGGIVFIWACSVVAASVVAASVVAASVA